MKRFHLPPCSPLGPAWLIRRNPPSRLGTGHIFALVLGVAGLLMSLDFSWKFALAESAVPLPGAPIASQSGGGVPSVSTRSMEEPLRLIQEARRSYARIRDYECTLIKQERLDGVLSPENVILMKVRTQPYSVNLAWKQPACACGQEACYVEGQNHGKMRARGAGVLGLVGFVSLDPQSPRARGASRYPINEAGIGYLIERFAAGWQLESRLNVTDVKIDLAEFNGKPGIRVEALHPIRAEGILYHRTVLWFDQLTNLPLRLENYDWPQSGQTQGDLVEQFSFVDLRVNVGLADAVFQK